MGSIIIVRVTKEVRALTPNTVIIVCKDSKLKFRLKDGVLHTI